MTRPFSFGKVELVASLDDAGSPAVPDPETPFRILILGDFSGRARRGVVETGKSLAGRRLVAIDRDDFDRVMDKLGVELHLTLAGEAGPPIVLRFRTLDDFHPDQIHAQAEVFRALRDRRRSPVRPSPPPHVTSQGPAEPTGDVAAPVPGNLLEQILAAKRAEAPRPAQEDDPWGEFIDRIMAPYRLAPQDPRLAEQQAGIDSARGRLMREILHHPDFQALEACWRGLHFLTSRLETDAQLALTLLDVSKAELAEDLGAAEDVRSSGISQRLIETQEDRPWAVLVGAMTFGPSPEDAALLGRLAELARRAGAPFLAAASPRLVGCASVAATPDPDDWESAPVPDGSWEALRRHPDAACVGLALPRFLLRMPYGRDSAPIESFAFEELSEEPDHEAYLWGNPAFALAELLGRSFRAEGWRLRPGVVAEVDGLPLHVERRDGEAAVKPCAEAHLTERAAEVLLDAGLMPLLSMRDRDIVRLGRFQSIARPAAPLAGRWR